MTRPITERMADGKARLEARGRQARVFFLSPDDMAEFKATNPPTVEAMFALPLGSKPSPMTCPAFDGVAVRETTRAPKRGGRVISNVYSHCGVAANVPWA